MYEVGIHVHFIQVVLSQGSVLAAGSFVALRKLAAQRALW